MVSGEWSGQVHFVGKVKVDFEGHFVGAVEEGYFEEAVEEGHFEEVVEGVIW